MSPLSYRWDKCQVALMSWWHLCQVGQWHLRRVGLVTVGQKSRHHKIYLLLDQNWEKVSRFAIISMSQQTSRSRLRFFALKRWSRVNRDILIVETKFLTLSRFSRLSKLTFWSCRDQESRSRSSRDKSRPPGLRNTKRIKILAKKWWFQYDWLINFF